MAPLRVLFLVMIIVTIVSVTSGGEVNGRTRGSSKFKLIKSHIKKGKELAGAKLKSLTGDLSKSSHAQKAKGWGKSANSKFKSVSDKHPGLKSAGEKLFAKFSGAKDSATQHTRSVGSKSSQVIKTAKREFNRIKTIIKGASLAANAQSKLSGITKTFSKARGLEGGSKFKSAVQQGSQKMNTFKEASKKKIGSLKEKGSGKLKTIKNSDSLKKIQNKIPDSAIQKLKNMPGSDKLKGLAKDSSAANAVKNKFSSLKGKFGLSS